MHFTFISFSSVLLSCLSEVLQNDVLVMSCLALSFILLGLCHKSKISCTEHGAKSGFLWNSCLCICEYIFFIKQDLISHFID